MIKQFMKMGGHSFATLLTHHTIKTVVEFGKGTVRMHNGCNFTKDTATVTISLSTAEPHEIGSNHPALYKTYDEMEDKADILLHFTNIESLLAVQAQVDEAIEYYKEECKKNKIEEFPNG